MQLILFVLLALAGCAGGFDARLNAERIAASGGLQRGEVAAAPFHLVTYARLGTAPVLRVYIEGDGHVFSSLYRASDDPTPWDPVALELAARDQGPSVAYVGRPCQYVTPGSDPACEPYYWTTRRYHEIVIASMNQAVDQLLAASGAERVELVGFSGGGVVAALIAARRHDVASLRTVAANLDTDAWTRRLGIDPLALSLNPADFTDRLVNIPQVHFSGGADQVVATAVTEAYRGRFTRLDCITVVVEATMGHHDRWSDIWQKLLRDIPQCVMK